MLIPEDEVKKLNALEIKMMNLHEDAEAFAKKYDLEIVKMSGTPNGHYSVLMETKK